MADTIVDFLRHGEPVGGRRYRGDGVDDPLSEKGWQQMWGALGDAAPWAAVVTSPMQRCQAFAVALTEKLSLPLTVEHRFREVGLGGWEGLSPDDILASDPDSYAAFYRDPRRNRPQGAETLEAFGARVAEALEQVLNDYTGQQVLVVAHAGVIRAALGHVLRSDPVAWYRTRIDNAALTRFRRGEYGTKLEFHNRSSLS